MLSDTIGENEGKTMHYAAIKLDQVDELGNQLYAEVTNERPKPLTLEEWKNAATQKALKALQPA